MLKTCWNQKLKEENMTTQISHPYIKMDKNIGQGKPLIAGTRTRVANIVAYYKLGYSAEELAREFPHLHLSQIHDALSFYYENKDEMDRAIDEDKEDCFK